MSEQSTLDEFSVAAETAGSELAGNSDEKPYRDEAWLRERYCGQRKTAQEVADEAGVSMSTVLKWMERHGIERRSGAAAQTDADVEKLQDEDWLREEYHQHEKTTTEIAEDLGVSQRTVWNWMEKHGIERRSMAEIRTEGDIEPLRNADWLRAQYWDEEKSSYDIADELGVRSITVRRWMDRHGIEQRDMSEIKSDGNITPLKDEEWVHEQYIERERSAHQIADELGVSANAVRDWLREHEIEIRSLSEANAQGDIAPLRDEEWVREKYEIEELEAVDLADELGVAVQTVISWMEKHGIERRSLSEVRLAEDAELPESPDWLREQYWEKNRSLADIAGELGTYASTVRRWMKKYGIERRSSDAGLEYIDHLDHPVRSDWELEVANLLFDSGVEYEYESIKFTYDDGRTYTPDFVTDDYVIEVKGRLYEDGNEERKARVAMEQLESREYVVVGTELPADIYIPWDRRRAVADLVE